jgi:ribosome-associated heat shock protein Hsp15
LAKQAIETGKIEIGSHLVKPSRSAKLQDQLQITRSDESIAITVIGTSEKRGSDSLAQTL